MLKNEVDDVCEISSLNKTKLLISAYLRIDYTKAFKMLSKKSKRDVAIVECQKNDSINLYLLQRIIQIDNVLKNSRHVRKKNVNLVILFFVLLLIINAKLFKLVERFIVNVQHLRILDDALEKQEIINELEVVKQRI